MTDWGRWLGLAEMRTVDPTELYKGPEDRVGQLCLCLALVYNDLKDTASHEALWRAARGSDRPLSWEEEGELNGLQVHGFRFVAGILHEFMRLIAKNANVLEEPELAGLCERLPAEAATHWAQMVAVAVGGQSDGSSVGDLLLRIRNNGAFHYSWKLVARGYSAFYSAKPSKFNEHACFSIGKSMMETRFYFADAAAQRLLASVGDSFDIEDAAVEVVRLGRSVNVAIGNLLALFLMQRGGYRSG